MVGADDDATQSDPSFSIDSDEESVIPRSWTDGSAKAGGPTIGRSHQVIGEEPSASAQDALPEAVDTDLIRSGWGSTKKGKKKSKVSVAQAVFEED